MNLKINLILTALLMAALSAFLITRNLYVKAKADKQRLTINLKHLNQDLDDYQTKNGHLAGKNAVLVFELSEFKNSFSGLSKDIQDLKIKLKRVESVNHTVIKSEKHIETTLKDSLITDTIKARTFHYQDKFYKLDGLAINKQQKVSIYSTDSLIQVVYKGKRKRPYLWIFSKRQLEQVITSKNPNSKIIYSKYIKIIK